MAAKTAQQKSDNLAPIIPEHLYPLPLLAAHAGLTMKHGIRAAQSNGLRVHLKHGRKYILGRDFIAYVTSGDGAGVTNR